jgi:hypothetical protein
MRVEELLDNQDGVIARRQALGAGMTDEAWEWRISSGRWRRLVPGVVVNHTGEPTRRQLAWAGHLHAGEASLISGDVALELRGFKGPLTSDVDVVVPAGKQIARAVLLPKVALVPHRLTKGSSGQSVNGLPCVGPHLAVLQAAAWAPDDSGAEWRVAAAVQQRKTAVPLLRSTLAQLPRLRRRALLREVLDDVELGAHAGTELAFLRFCRTFGLPLPDSLQLAVRQCGKKHYLDARYKRQRVTIELDGAHHRDAGQWSADTLRTLRVAVAMPGEQVFRLTMYNLRHDGSETAALLRVILACPKNYGLHPHPEAGVAPQIFVR